MDNKKIKDIIDNGRNFMKFYAEDEFSDYQSDQDLKKPQPPLVKEKISIDVIDLPKDFSKLNLNDNLYDLLVKRKSNRVFTNECFTLLELSFVLWGIQGIKSIRGNNYATLRTVPSGGARHPFETYMIINNIDGLKKGRYHYLPLTHQIEYIGEEVRKEEISESLVNQVWGSKANVVLYFSCVAYRAEWRYGIYAHRTALIDLGHVGENAYLTVSSINKGCCGIAAFDCDKCNELFNLDGKEEFMVYTIPVGTIDASNLKDEQAFYSFLDE